MKDQLISYETAVLAKEKGFRLHVLHSYDAEDGRPTLYIGGYKGIGEHGNTKADWNTPKKYKSYSAPTQSLLQKWLRDIHTIHIDVSFLGRFEWIVQVYNIQESIERPINLQDFKTYEQALEKGLIEALKLIKK